ncbi:HAD family hydrolase [Flavimarina sp. Hel_I_48]|uniref:HAD family hydrolase n=1 Tax=Flavimarina sp. Hel_I_48 TaxID=1392488 RepID=UPI0009DCA0F6|nr:HAD family phosphatase [Flavimarina sp. Hel_I_48]
MKTTKSLSCKALIFDMDGTMVDNMMVHHRAWQQKLKELGRDLTLDEVMRDIHGVNDEILKRLFGDRFSEGEMQEIAKDKEATYRELYAEDIKLVPGLARFLKEAKALGIPMGIGTAAPAENLEFTVKALDLQEYFSVFIHAGDVKKGKPDPEVFTKVAEKLNVKIEDAIIFEDSPTGAKAAENGKAKSFVLTSTHQKSDFEGIKAIGGFLEDFRSFSIKKGEKTGDFVISCAPDALPAD